MRDFSAGRAADDKPAKPEKSERGGLSERLALESRFVLVFGEIDDKLARQVCERLILLAQDSEAPIRMLISSPGGHVESGDAVHDMIRFVRAPITCIGTGWVASAATHIFLAAPRERRLCLPNTRFMIHQPAGGAGGRATDIAIQAKEIIKVRERLAGVIARETGQPAEKVRADMERDYWMTADEAIAYGIAARVIVNQKELD
ncbi:MAG: ATP-dependent Clp protease proteolytic subunit [Rubrivivax sp. SCN 71-131]|jgi:ATP-dependent Clp protease protease subunit|nr:MAG: ATP-dependent Clp protease proteolytic subunit [Rubrivivax sp. SCN 71-131]